MKIAMVIPPDGPVYTVSLPERGTEELRELQGYVGGWIELVPTEAPVSVFCNEEGKLDGLPANPRATALFNSLLAPWDVIVGTVVVLGPVDDRSGDTRSLENAQEWIARAEAVMA